MIDYRHPKRVTRTNTSVKLGKGDEITLTTRPIVTRAR